MNLIDADEMIKRLEEWNTSDDTDKAFYNFTMRRIIEQPTAYDIDEVTQELCKKSFVDWEEEFVDNGECLIYLADAIEIVKGGK